MGLLQSAGAASLILVGLACLAGCGDGGARDTGSLTGSTEVVSDVVVLTGDGGRDARVEGRVTLLGNCAGIGDAVAIWPTGTTLVKEHPLILDVPGLGEVAAGETISGGGGAFDLAVDDVAVTIPESCGTTHGIQFYVE